MGKFNNFLGSTFAVRRLSDLICAEHGLSIIENPKPSKGKNYADWLGDKELSWQEKLRRKIDEVLPACATFDDFLAVMRSTGYTVNDKRKHITFLAPGQKKPTRLDTLKGEYTEAAIRERIAEAKVISSASGGRTTAAVGMEEVFNEETPDTARAVFPNERNGEHIPVARASSQVAGASRMRSIRPASHNEHPAHVNLLIDIQAKIRDGKGAGGLQYRGCKSYTLYFIRQHKRLRHTNGCGPTLKGAWT
jgi:hypothetical protein